MEQLYFAQLEKQYTTYLSSIIQEISLFPLVLRGGKNRPGTTIELHQAVASFQKHEKSVDRHGWVVEWEEWKSKVLGRQQWPGKISIVSEEDYLCLLSKETEVIQFKKQLNQLLEWQPLLKPWLTERPLSVIKYAAIWADICRVVSYLLENDVSHHYIRSLPIPVHTKFIEQNQPLIVSLLKYLSPDRLRENSKNLETGLELRTKPHLFPVRWLDHALATQYSDGMDILAITKTSLLNVSWKVKEIWLVENETNLYLFNDRPEALAICSQGYAANLLSGIPLLHNSNLYYWGDLDEHGFIVLQQFRKHYPHVQSMFMDIDTVVFHQLEMVAQPGSYKTLSFSLLLPIEEMAFSLLASRNGRIEQEKLQLKYVQERLDLIH